MFGAPVAPALEVFVSSLRSGADGTSEQRPLTPDEAPAWAPPELRVFAEAPDGAVLGVVVPHPERPAPDWPVARYTRTGGATVLGHTARQALPELVDGYLPEAPDELALSLLRVRLAVAPEPDAAWPDLDGLCRVHVADGLHLVVPRASVDQADFRRGARDIVGSARELVRRGRAGSALAMCRAAAFEAFRAGDDALGLALRDEVVRACEALARRW